jgi:simple sugar transport system ATP-binding protein
MFDGHVMGERDPAQTNERELGLLMAGITDTSAVADAGDGAAEEALNDG